MPKNSYVLAQRRRKFRSFLDVRGCNYMLASLDGNEDVRAAYIEGVLRVA